MSAAVQQTALAIFLPAMMTIHCRLLFRSENHLWNRVAKRMGPEWASHQRRSLGVHGEALRIRCRSTLMLYRLATAHARRILTPHQREIVRAGCSLTLSEASRV